MTLVCTNVADTALLLMQTAVHACVHAYRPHLFGTYADTLRDMHLCAGEDCGERS